MEIQQWEASKTEEDEDILIQSGVLTQSEAKEKLVFSTVAIIIGKIVIKALVRYAFRHAIRRLTQYAARQALRRLATYTAKRYIKRSTARILMRLSKKAIKYVGKKVMRGLKDKYALCVKNKCVPLVSGELVQTNVASPTYIDVGASAINHADDSGLPVKYSQATIKSWCDATSTCLGYYAARNNAYWRGLKKGARINFWYTGNHGFKVFKKAAAPSSPSPQQSRVSKCGSNCAREYATVVETNINRFEKMWSGKTTAQCYAANDDCPLSTPYRYSGTNRCFKTGSPNWGGAMCNIDPARDVAHHRRDTKCDCTPVPGFDNRLFKHERFGCQSFLRRNSVTVNPETLCYGRGWFKNNCCK